MLIIREKGLFRLWRRLIHCMGKRVIHGEVCAWERSWKIWLRVDEIGALIKVKKRDSRLCFDDSLTKLGRRIEGLCLRGSGSWDLVKRSLAEAL